MKRLVVKASSLQPGDRLLNGKVVSFRMPIDASQTPSLMHRLKCMEFAAIGFVGESLPVLFTDTIKFAVDRPSGERNEKD